MSFHSGRRRLLEAGMTTASRTIIDVHEPVLVTGAAGCVGRRVVAALLERGFTHIRCFTRPGRDIAGLEAMAGRTGHARLDIVQGNLLSIDDCMRATDGVAVVYHLAAGTGEKSFADAFMNSVVTTRNVLEATLRHRDLKRFVNVSSFAVYTNRGGQRVLDEACPIEIEPRGRGEAYCYAKSKQDELVTEYGRKHAIPYVLVRPGVVYGPGMSGISGRVGSSAFGVFLHLGGPNVIPLTHVDNCAEAIVLAGIVSEIDGETFNIVDDDLPRSREFLRRYKR